MENALNQPDADIQCASHAHGLPHVPTRVSPTHLFPLPFSTHDRFLSAIPSFLSYPPSLSFSNAKSHRGCSRWPTPPETPGYGAKEGGRGCSRLVGRPATYAAAAAHGASSSTTAAMLRRSVVAMQQGAATRPPELLQRWH